MQNGTGPDDTWRKVGVVSGLAGEVAGLVLVATYGGAKADEALGTTPWLLVFSVFLATCLVFVLIWRLRRWFL